MLTPHKLIHVWTQFLLGLLVLALVGCVPILPPRQIAEKVVESRNIGGRHVESIVQKTFEVQLFVPLNPDAVPFPRDRYDKYYLRSEKDYKLFDVHAGIEQIAHAHRPEITGTYERFIPIYDSSLWVCLVQEIVDIDIVNTLVIVLDKHKMRNQFFVKNCLRNEGRSWAIDWEDGHTEVLRIHTKGGTIKYDVKSDKRIK